MNIVKVNAKIVQDNSYMFTEIPVLLDKNRQVIKPLMEYALHLKTNGRSQSTINNVVRATQLLLYYISVNPNVFTSPREAFENFSSRLYTGTIGNDGLDASGLYWLPCSNQVASLHINALNLFTDWLANKYGITSMNPLVDADDLTKQLKFAAWFCKNQYDFLGHIEDKHRNETVLKARSILGKRALGKQKQDAIEFPEKYFGDFYFKGLGGALDKRAALRDQLILLLMHGGGLRESETLHLWIEDVVIDSFNNNSVKVRIYHPEEGRAPNNWRSGSGKYTRAAYLKEKYGLSPRNQLISKMHVGWKGRMVDHPENYIEVHWFPTVFGEVFAKLWSNYTKILTRINRNHPYAFVSFHHSNCGSPYTLNAFHYNYNQSLRRIGLQPSKANGLSAHSHRHSYGKRLRRADIHSLMIKKCLHHSSINSQLIYTGPTIKEINLSLNAASKRLLDTTKQIENTVTPSWDVLMQFGFSDIDPDGLFSGLNPQLGKYNGYK